MPHTYINEEDNTLPGGLDENTNIVFIPGLLETDAEWDLETEDPIRLFRSVKAFIKAAGDPKDNNLNSIMAKHLLESGMPVLFEAVGKVSDTEFIEDTPSTGLPVLDFDAVAAAVDWMELTDKGLYKVKFLTTGAAKTGAFIPSGESTTVGENMMLCAERRGDCIALLDHEKEITVPTGKTPAEVIHEEFSEMAEESGAKFSAVFSPWCKCTLSKEGMELPASFVYLAAYAYSNKFNPNWFAYAGSQRGKAPFKVEPMIKFGDAAAAVLQSRDINPDGSFGADDNIGYAINPICNIDAFGNIVWGNRTLKNNESGLTASSFLNIRNLVCDIKKELYRASRKYAFEQNDDILWANFCGDVTPLLDKAKSGRGVRGYKLINEDTDVKGRLKALVQIAPIYPAEDMELTVEMTDTMDTASVTENA